MSKHFKLYQNCILVKGFAQSTICDLQHQRYVVVPNILYEILSNNENDSPTVEELIAMYNSHAEGLQKYLQYLAENEFGFYTTHPEYFPKMPTDWDFPATISNAIVDIDNNSVYDLGKLASQLIKVQAYAVQVRFFKPITYDRVASALACLLSKLHPHVVEIVIPYFEDIDYFSLLEFNERITKILVYSAITDKSIYKEEFACEVVYTQQEIKDESACGRIDPKGFHCNIQLYTESLLYNNCLNRKVGIDKYGQVKNCPSCVKSFGNIGTLNLLEVVLSEEFSSLWRIRKDDIETCRDCEYRYMCVDCRAYRSTVDMYSKPEKCNYNPYTISWESKT